MRARTMPSDEDSSDDSDEEIILLGKTMAQRLNIVNGAAATKAVKRVLVIIDLNGLFFDRVVRRSKGRQHVPENATVLGSYIVHERPGLGVFLDYLFQNFDVMIWSSAKMANIERLVKHAFGKRKFVTIWDQKKCTARTPHPTLKHKPCLFLKKVQHFWDAYDEWDATNTILIDDSPLKAMENPPHTSVHPDEWTRSMSDDAELMEGVGSIRNFLEGLRNDVVVTGKLSLAEYVAGQTFLRAHAGAQ